MKKRIWELDTFRGLCVIGMIVFHLFYDLISLYGILDWNYPGWLMFIQDWSSLSFIAISGICVTLGSRCIRRGLQVFACGMLCTLVTWGMYRFGFAYKGIIIYFGVLHCLGCCMLLWPVFRRLPWWSLPGIGISLCFLGHWLPDRVQVHTMYLMPLGFVPSSFVSSDYFPLLFHLGFFLLGATLGKTVYRNKTTLLPTVDPSCAPVKALLWLGSNSLIIYLVHQPVLALICWLITLL